MTAHGLEFSTSRAVIDRPYSPFGCGCAALYLCISFLLIGMFTLPSLAQQKPQLALSTSKVHLGDAVRMRGAGFTPNRYALSHLRRPDGTEYPVKQFRADDHGEFTHIVETLLMEVGTYELWAIDENSKAVSNTVKFEVSLTPPDSSKAPSQ